MYIASCMFFIFREIQIKSKLGQLIHLFVFFSITCRRLDVGLWNVDKFDGSFFVILVDSNVYFFLFDFQSKPSMLFSQGDIRFGTFVRWKWLQTNYYRRQASQCSWKLNVQYFWWNDCNDRSKFWCKFFQNGANGASVEEYNQWVKAVNVKCRLFTWNFYIGYDLK